MELLTSEPVEVFVEEVPLVVEEAVLDVLVEVVEEEVLLLT